jgi:hypothetical protein
MYYLSPFLEHSNLEPYKLAIDLVSQLEIAIDSLGEIKIPLAIYL